MVREVATVRRDDGLHGELRAARDVVVDDVDELRAGLVLALRAREIGLHDDLRDRRRFEVRHDLPRRDQPHRVAGAARRDLDQRAMVAEVGRAQAGAQHDVAVGRLERDLQRRVRARHGAELHVPVPFVAAQRRDDLAALRRRDAAEVERRERAQVDRRLDAEGEPDLPLDAARAVSVAKVRSTPKPDVGWCVGSSY